MADDNDDSWLYGAGQDEAAHLEANQQDEIDVSPVKNGNESKTYENTFDEHNFEEAGENEHLVADDSKDGRDDDGAPGDGLDDSDDDDDDINVVIGDIKSGGTSSYVKNPQDKQKQPGSKFNIEEFEFVGSINGQPAYEYAIENIEDKPWRKPGADITDYFNYGFNEETWRAYCERQKKMRIHESGIGLAGLTAAQNPSGSEPRQQGINIGIKRGFGGPRQKPSGTIDVIGAPSQNPIRPPAPRENVIQVMTADRREYSRTVVGNNQQGSMPHQFNAPPGEFYNHEEQDAFNYGYEPTQDSQWEGNSGWAPSEIKELTGMNQPPPMMPLNVPPPMMGGMPRMPMNMMGQPGMIPPLMSQVIPGMKPGDGRDRRDRDGRHYDDSRKRPRERSTSRDRDRRERERPRDDRRDRDSRYREREASSRREPSRRSRSRDRTKRSKSKERPRKSRSKERKPEDKDRATRSDKSSSRKKKDEA